MLECFLGKRSRTGYLKSIWHCKIWILMSSFGSLNHARLAYFYRERKDYLEKIQKTRCEPRSIHISEKVVRVYVHWGVPCTVPHNAKLVVPRAESRKRLVSMTKEQWAWSKKKPLCKNNWKFFPLLPHVARKKNSGRSNRRGVRPRFYGVWRDIVGHSNQEKYRQSFSGLCVKQIFGWLFKAVVELFPGIYV